MEIELFKSALQNITSKVFEDDKLQAAKELINSSVLTAVQVRQIMENFNFENSKVDFAAYAFPMISDKQNFNVVQEIFEHESSKNQINDFLKTAHGWYN